MYSYCSAQNKITITIDDAPNHLSSIDLMHALDNYKIPVCLFINEGRPISKKSNHTATQFLSRWAMREYITLANHTFSHSRYSAVNFESFKNDIIKGEKISKELAKKKNKKIDYFRFPYNDLGADSAAHDTMRFFLNSRGYTIAPFTIESVDWLYAAVYEHFLSLNDTAKANQMGRDYVSKTMEFVSFFEKISNDRYNRNISHIYQCHDNRMNVKYLPLILDKLKERGYEFISLEDALKDEVYSSQDHYYKKWGISWMYRWMDNPDERKNLILSEPKTDEIEKLYNEIK